MSHSVNEQGVLEQEIFTYLWEHWYESTREENARYIVFLLAYHFQACCGAITVAELVSLIPRVQQLLANAGMPDSGEVGRDGSNAAFLLVMGTLCPSLAGWSARPQATELLSSQEEAKR